MDQPSTSKGQLDKKDPEYLRMLNRNRVAKSRAKKKNEILVKMLEEEKIDGEQQANLAEMLKNEKELDMMIANENLALLDLLKRANLDDEILTEFKFASEELDPFQADKDKYKKAVEGDSLARNNLVKELVSLKKMNEIIDESFERFMNKMEPLVGKDTLEKVIDEFSPFQVSDKDLNETFEKLFGEGIDLDERVEKIINGELDLFK